MPCLVHKSLSRTTGANSSLRKWKSHPQGPLAGHTEENSNLVRNGDASRSFKKNQYAYMTTGPQKVENCRGKIHVKAKLM